MKISVITAFYHGNKYIEGYEQMMELNEKSLNPEDELEVILVNDSPEEAVNLSGVHASRTNWKIINHKKNSGIHKARLTGLSKASGEYVIFLDQDDSLSKNALSEFTDFVKTDNGASDVYVSNALLEQRDGSEVKWYRTPYHTRVIGSLFTYTAVGIQIISPGQCLIKKDSIPEAWSKYTIKNNGADDYFLWLLMLDSDKKFTYINKTLYKHCYTASNLSSDTTVTDDSTTEFINYLKAVGFSASKLKLLKRQTRYKAAFRMYNLLGKLMVSIVNPDIFLYNIYFKIRTRTGYKFNR